MRYALVNPAWNFAGSIYFGCREPHLPLEYGYAKALLERAGHTAQIIDGTLDGLSPEAILNAVRDLAPDFTVVTSAPSYLFWRCAPPELRIPRELIGMLRHTLGDGAGRIILIGPHASTTPVTALRKTGADAAILGECEDILPLLADMPWNAISSLACVDQDGAIRVQGAPHATDMASLPALHWPEASIRRHTHHHHRFESAPTGPGAEMETSRGCPYACTFCAKENFRNRYRRRPLPVILDELDALIAQGVEYVYFIDEIFLPNRDLLIALAARPIRFGIQTRIDLWDEAALDLLGMAGCVSIEAGIESISGEGRALLAKNCKLSTDELAERLIRAKRHVPFVQANLLEAGTDDPAAIQAWRERLIGQGVWASEPVPLFPYPGSPDYTRLWGQLDDQAWERAHAHYLAVYRHFSDIQEAQPLPLPELEGLCTS